MPLTHHQIREIVVECLYQTLGDKLHNVSLTDKIDPINNLGLESCDGLVFAITISEKLPFQIPKSINPLVDDKRKRGRKVGQIVDFIYNLMLAQEEEVNA